MQDPPHTQILPLPESLFLPTFQWLLILRTTFLLGMAFLTGNIHQRSWYDCCSCSRFSCSRETQFFSLNLTPHEAVIRQHIVTATRSYPPRASLAGPQSSLQHLPNDMMIYYQDPLRTKANFASLKTITIVWVPPKSSHRDKTGKT